jgi:hypothetical protein
MIIIIIILILTIFSSLSSSLSSFAYAAFSYLHILLIYVTRKAIAYYEPIIDISKSVSFQDLDCVPSQVSKVAPTVLVSTSKI